MDRYFKGQLEGTTGNCMLLYLVEQDDGGLFTERTPHTVGNPIKLDCREFVRMHTYNLPVFKQI